MLLINVPIRHKLYYTSLSSKILKNTRRETRYLLNAINQHITLPQTKRSSQDIIDCHLEKIRWIPLCTISWNITNALGDHFTSLFFDLVVIPYNIGPYTTILMPVRPSYILIRWPMVYCNSWQPKFQCILMQRTKLCKILLRFLNVYALSQLLSIALSSIYINYIQHKYY